MCFFQRAYLYFPSVYLTAEFPPLQFNTWEDEMDVSKNNGIPKASILIGFFIINSPSILVVFPLFLETSKWAMKKNKKGRAPGDKNW